MPKLNYAVSSMILLAFALRSAAQSPAPKTNPGASSQRPLFVEQVTPAGPSEEQKSLAEVTRSLNAISKNLGDASSAKNASDIEVAARTADLAIYTRGLFIATLFLAAGTVALVVVGVIQSIDAKKSIQAATRSAAASEKALATIERPWLVFDSINLPPHSMGVVGSPNNWMIEFNFKNIGKTPALISGVELNIVDKSNMPKSPDYSKAIAVPIDRIFPPGHAATTHRIGPSPGSGVKNGVPVQFVVYGRARYTDLAGQAHTTGFAVEIFPMAPAHGAYGQEGFEYYT